MKLLNVVGRKTNNAPVLTADAVLACELKNNSFADRQHCACEVASHHDVWPWSVCAERVLNRAPLRLLAGAGRAPRAACRRIPQIQRQPAQLDDIRQLLGSLGDGTMALHCNVAPCGRRSDRSRHRCQSSSASAIEACTSHNASSASELIPSGFSLS